MVDQEVLERYLDAPLHRLLAPRSRVAVAVVGTMTKQLFDEVAVVCRVLERPLGMTAFNQLDTLVKRLTLTDEEFSRLRWLVSLADNRAGELMIGQYGLHGQGQLDAQNAHQEMLAMAAGTLNSMQHQAARYMPRLRLTCSIDPSWALPRPGMIYSLMEAWNAPARVPLFFLAKNKDKKPLSCRGLRFVECTSSQKFYSAVENILQVAHHA